jgi:hypothetical protein
MGAEQLAALKYSPKQITGMREEVRRAFMAKSERVKCGQITCMADSDLRLLYEIYDYVFLEDYFKTTFTGVLTFSLSTRMSKSAGKIISPRNLRALPPGQEHYEVRMGIKLFFQYYGLSREKTVNGIRTKDALEAFQIVFEHELCHLIELHLYRQSSCHQNRFKTIARNLFGHTESYHRLPTAAEIAGDRYDLAPGDQVSFNHEGEILQGVIQRINQRATVMVRDKKGQYRDRQGHRYTKWYVPLPMLKKD